MQFSSHSNFHRSSPSCWKSPLLFVEICLKTESLEQPLRLCAKTEEIGRLQALSEMQAANVLKAGEKGPIICVLLIICSAFT